MTWTINGQLVLTWVETGGLGLRLQCDQEGFGSTLVRATMSGLGGEIDREWGDSGLTITLKVPLNRATG